MKHIKEKVDFYENKRQKMNSQEGKILNTKINEKRQFAYRPRTKVARKILNILETDEFIKYNGVTVYPTCNITLKIFRHQIPIKISGIEEKIRLYLRAPLTGQLLITTNKGLVGHREAIERRIGGYIIGYYY